jgi:glycosyltransferase involved in cell wall biosynthesis
MRVAFVFPNPRLPLLAAIEQGKEPDSILLGANHFNGTGIEAVVHDPLLTRRRYGRLLDRIMWSLRELTLPFEVRKSDLLFTPLANLVPIAARMRTRPRVIVINYGLNVTFFRSSAARRRLLTRSLRAAERVIALGESQRREMIEEMGVPSERTSVMPLPIDERWWSPPPAPVDTDPYVLTVGKDLARDFRTFVDAVARMDIRAEMAVYPRNLDGIELPANVRARKVPSQTLRELYAGASCVVVPQRRDGYPYGSEGGGLTALLEAMAMGLPVVATERAILRDYIDDGVDAIVVPPQDPGALRDAIDRICGDPDLAARVGGAGRRRVERAHPTRKFARDLIPLFTGVEASSAAMQSCARA